MPLTAVRACGVEKITPEKKRPEKCLCEQISGLCVLFSSNRVCCHCGERHNADLNLSGTESECVIRLWANGLQSAYIPKPFKESLEFFNDSFFLSLAISATTATFTNPSREIHGNEIATLPIATTATTHPSATATTAMSRWERQYKANIERKTLPSLPNGGVGRRA